MDLLFLFCVGVEPLKLWPARPDSVPLYTIKKSIGPFFWYDSKNWTSFLFDSKNWTFLNMTQRIEPFFLNTTHRIEPFFWMWLQELNPFLRMWHKELNFFENATQRIEIFFFFLKKKETQRIEPLFFEYDSKNWTLFLWTWRKELNPFFLNTIHRIEPFVSWIWFTELNPLFLEYDSQNWTFLKIWLTELNLKLFWNYSKNWNFSDMIQRIETFLLWLKELKLLFIRLKELNAAFFFWKTQRIEPSFLTRLKEWTFIYMTQRIEPSFLQWL